MKKLIQLSATAALFSLLLQNSAFSSEFQQGIHFKEIIPAIETSAPLDKVEVLELFWYGCPHCYEFEAFIAKWAEKKNDNIHFRRVPAVFNDQWKLHAKAFYAAIDMDEISNTHFSLFKAIHVDKRQIFSKAEIGDFFYERGVRQNDFKKSFNSFSVETEARKALNLTVKSKINGVPAMVINGKYSTTSSQSGGYERMLQLVDILVNRELANRNK